VRARQAPEQARPRYVAPACELAFRQPCGPVRYLIGRSSYQGAGFRPDGASGAGGWQPVGCQRRAVAAAGLAAGHVSVARTSGRAPRWSTASRAGVRMMHSLGSASSSAEHRMLLGGES
jgi:hypothetical protein